MELHRKFDMNDSTRKLSSPPNTTKYVDFTADLRMERPLGEAAFLQPLVTSSTCIIINLWREYGEELFSGSLKKIINVFALFLFVYRFGWCSESAK